jgi:hypothetical protein
MIAKKMFITPPTLSLIDTKIDTLRKEVKREVMKEVKREVMKEVKREVMKEVKREVMKEVEQGIHQLGMSKQHVMILHSESIEVKKLQEVVVGLLIAQHMMNFSIPREELEGLEVVAINMRNTTIKIGELHKSMELYQDTTKISITRRKNIKVNMIGKGQ